MLRSILVALDDTQGAKAARDAAIALSRRSGAALTAAVVLDRPHTDSEHEFVPIGGAAFKARRDAARVKRAQEDAQLALAECAQAAAGHPYEEMRLEDAPEPALLRAGATHDLLVIGRDSTLGLEATEDGVAPVIERLLMEGARPLLVVPPEAAPADGPILVGYDASIPAMAALQLFALLGMAEGAPVRVASAAETRAEALAMAEEGCTYLRRHGLEATPLPLLGDRPADLLLAEAEGLRARLLVVGSFEESGLRRLFTGSATHELLRRARCPVFIHH
ncbi:universal stress protein [Falsiroseomonas selenitidurans]|uniref:Universal stress protein n=1 Tax=Falsiroseomonas selenitidurans TaxID=2716335 RepID=A0ABX1E1R4_9PROT|nr:universal stress protein [Falsiroseomonas selenitidurans]NKC30981.1 universal stress protein [Falsiroseomonas selenitidurans]